MLALWSCAAALMGLFLAEGHVCFASRVSDTKCTNPIPLSSVFKGGVDLTAVDLNVLPSRSVRSDIFDWTCEAGNTYKGYDVPDQITALRPIPSSQCSIGSWTESFVFNAFEHLSVDFSSSYFFGLLSSSQAFSESVSAMIKQNATVGVAACSVTTFEVILAQPFLLSPGRDLIKTIQHFAGNSNGSSCVAFSQDTVDGYNQIINAYGTGYLANGTVGGVAQYFFASASAATDFMEEGDLSLNAGASLFNIVAMAGGASGHEDVNEHFNQTLAFSHARALGGDTSPFAGKGQWQEWEKSVFDHPTVVDVQMQNLSTLVAQWDKQCGSQLALAERNYYIRSFLSNQVMPLLQLVGTYLTSQTWPLCEFNPDNTTRCLPDELASQIADIKASVTSTLKQSGVTKLGDAVLIAAETAALVAKLPPPAPTLSKPQLEPKVNTTIPHAAFCGLSFSSQELYPGELAKNGGYLSWLVNSFDASTGSCITYSAARDMAAHGDFNMKTFDVVYPVQKALGSFWLCQAVRFDCLPLFGDDCNLTVAQNESSGVWSVSLERGGSTSSSASVACIEKPLPLVPTSVRTYTKVTQGQNVGKHFVCWLNALYMKPGYSDNPTISQDGDGNWIYEGHFPTTVLCVG